MVLYAPSDFQNEENFLKNICLHLYGRSGTYYECRYTSLPQCNASASGRAAECVVNPYFASAQVPARYRHRRVY